MKIKSYTYPIAITSLLSVAILFSSFDDNGNKVANGAGQAGGTTAPGDTHTCSQSGCHGAGNGNSSSGGLIDNAGPGNITISSTPSMPGNTYVPGTVYQMSITVNETGKAIFGFVAQMLDNSGNTNLAVDNTAGTITITDAVHTHTAASFGTGRKDVTHSLNGGLSNNSATFVYGWTAPASGTVNIYTSATACNHDGLSSALDNCYNKHVVIVPATATGIEKNLTQTSVHLFPNPTNSEFSLSFNTKSDDAYMVSIYSLGGKLIKDFGLTTSASRIFNQSFNISELSSGMYLVKVSSKNESVYKKLSINN
jgi:hypothetical protein